MTPPKILNVYCTKMYRVGFLLFFFVIGFSSVEAQGIRNCQLFMDGWQFSKQMPKNNDWQPVTLPHTFNKDDMQQDKSYYTGDAYYRKIFTLPESLKDKRVFLRFEGVGSVAEIFLNGKYLTQHKGAFTAFAFEITNMVHLGMSDTLLVKVNNASRKDVIPINMNLFPVYGGIYRPVALITTNKINFTVTDYASSGVYIKQKTQKRQGGSNCTI